MATKAAIEITTIEPNTIYSLANTFAVKTVQLTLSDNNYLDKLRRNLFRLVTFEQHGSVLIEIIWTLESRRLA